MVTFFKLVGILWSLWSPPAAAPLLSGPSVTTAAPRVTLVARDFDGKIARLETEPETAAVLRLNLSTQQRAAVEGLITQRMLALDRLVTANYQVIVDAGAALQRGKQATAEERRELPKLYGALQQALKPWHDRGTFLDEAGALLTPEQAATAQALTDEYRGALAREAAKDGPVDATPAQLRMRANLEELGRLVRQSIQRRADMARARLDTLVLDLDLSPEQTEQVRALFMEYSVGVIQGTRDAALSKREQQDYMTNLAKILTPDQRTRLGELMIAGNPKARR